MGKHKYIELDVTNACNLRCNNCTRRIDLRPGQDFLSMESLRAFVDEARSFPLRRIVIMGGEPTLHPQIQEIVKTVADLASTLYKCTPILVSNCHDGFSKMICDEFESIVDVRREPKIPHKRSGGAGLNDFWTMNVAPIDFPEFAETRFSEGCKQKDRCGYTRSVHGLYYACAMASPIDEIFELGVGVKKLTDVESAEKKQLDALCRYCGRLRVEYDLGWAFFDKTWKSQAFAENKKAWPIYSSRRLLSESWQKICQ